MTTRREAITAASAAAFGTIAILPSRLKAAEFQYKVGFGAPADDPTTVRFTEMANQIRTESGGRLDIKVFPNSQLGGEDAMLSQLRIGALDFHIGTTGLSGLVPSVGIELTPFAFRSDAVAFAAADGALGAYIAKQIEAAGMVAFPLRWALGFRQITTNVKPIRNADDIVGLKIRTPSGKVFLDTFRALGASPTPMPLAEAYTSLQTHVIDAQENPYAFIEENHYYEVQKYLCVTNHIWLGSWMVGNRDRWNALPPDVREIASRNIRKYTLLQRRDQQARDMEAAEKLRSSMAFNTVDRDSFRAKLQQTYQRWKSDFGSTLWGLLEQYAGKLA